MRSERCVVAITPLFTCECDSPNVYIFPLPGSSASSPDVSKVQILLIGQVEKCEPIALFCELRESISACVFAPENDVEQAREYDDAAITVLCVSFSTHTCLSSKTFDQQRSNIDIKIVTSRVRR